MCGLCGMVFERHRRTARTRQRLLNAFTRLLVLSESRGNHASGVAWVKADGSYGVFKAPMPASELVCRKGYAEVLAAVDNTTTILMGHTRWRTQGSERNNDNNHPLVLEAQGNSRDAHAVLVTHNGHISNAESLFRRFHCPRQAQVDSEILAHFAAAAVTHDDLDMNDLRRRLALCRGTMSAVMASTAVPKTVLIVKGNKPLIFLHSRRYRAIAYASDISFLLRALEDEPGWEELRVPPMTLAAFDCERLTNCRQEPFTLGFPTVRGRRS